MRIRPRSRVALCRVSPHVVKRSVGLLLEEVSLSMKVPTTLFVPLGVDHTHASMGSPRTRLDDTGAYETALTWHLVRRIHNANPVVEQRALRPPGLRNPER